MTEATVIITAPVLAPKTILTAIAKEAGVTINVKIRHVITKSNVTVTVNAVALLKTIIANATMDSREIIAKMLTRMLRPVTGVTAIIREIVVE